jgi:hypothetical protein
MNRSAFRCAALALSLSAALGLAVKACSNPELREMPGEKEEWSILQATELQTRDIRLGEPVIRNLYGQDVLGLKGASGQNVWILLKPASPPFYKQLPDGQYDVPIALIERLQRERRLSYTVNMVLHSHVRQP